jgi:hypothetical protein
VSNPIGQHFVRGRASAVNNGQSSRIRPGADVGDESGGEHQNAVPASRPDADVDMVHGAESSPFYEANVRRKETSKWNSIERTTHSP